MNINYRILEINDDEHCITIRFWTDDTTEDSMASFFDQNGDIVRTDEGYPVRCRTDYNISFENINNPTIDDLEKIVNSNFPYGWFKTIEKKKKDTTSMSLNEFKKLQGKKITKEYVETDKNSSSLKKMMGTLFTLEEWTEVFLDTITRNKEKILEILSKQ